jgi:hypothetical protein
MLPPDARDDWEAGPMIELECPLCEQVLLVAPAAVELACRDCAITVAIVDGEERPALARAA